MTGYSSRRIQYITKPTMKRKNTVVSCLVTAVILMLSVTIASPSQSVVPKFIIDSNNNNNSLIQRAVAQEQPGYAYLPNSCDRCKFIHDYLRVLTEGRGDNPAHIKRSDEAIKKADDWIKVYDERGNKLWPTVTHFYNELGKLIDAKKTAPPVMQAVYDAAIDKLVEKYQPYTDAYRDNVKGRDSWLKSKWDWERSKIWRVPDPKTKKSLYDMKMEFLLNILESAWCKHYYPPPTRGVLSCHDEFIFGFQTYNDGTRRQVNYCAECKDKRDQYDAQLNFIIELQYSQITDYIFLLEAKMIADKMHTEWTKKGPPEYTQTGYRHEMNQGLAPLYVAQLNKIEIFTKLLKQGAVHLEPDPKDLEKRSPAQIKLDTLRQELIKCIEEKCKDPCPIAPGTPSTPGVCTPGCACVDSAFDQSATDQLQQGADFAPPSATDQLQQGADFAPPSATDQLQSREGPSTETQRPPAEVEGPPPAEGQ